MVEMCDLVFVSQTDTLHRSLLITGNLSTAMSTIFLNSLILFSIYKTPHLRKPSHLLIAHLALADLMVGALCQPLSVLRDVLVLEGESFSGICLTATLARLFGYWLGSVSLYTLVVISIDRMLVIKLKTSYKSTVTAKTIMAVLLFWWIVGAALFCALFFFIHGEVQTFLIAISIGLIIFLTVITVSYAVAVKELKKYSSQVTPSDNQTSNTSTSSQLDVSKFRRSLKTMLIVLCSIMAFYIPYGCICTAFTVLFAKDNASDHHILYQSLDGSEVLVLANSTVNPLLYLWRMRELREVVKTTVRWVFGWKTRNESNNQAIRIQLGQLNQE